MGTTSASQPSLGRLLALRLVNSCSVPDDALLEHALFLKLAEGIAPDFSPAAANGVLCGDSFAERLNASLMRQLHEGAVYPRCAALMPAFILTRLGDWLPFQIWRSFLEGQELAPLALVLNAPEEVETADGEILQLLPVEFRVTPWLPEAA